MKRFKKTKCVRENPLFCLNLQTAQDKSQWTHSSQLKQKPLQSSVQSGSMVVIQLY